MGGPAEGTRSRPGESNCLKEPGPVNMSRRAVVFGRYLGAVVALAAVAGCLFDTREAVPPGTLEAQCPLTELTHPDSVAVGLIVAVECRDSTGAPTGIPNYER